MKQIRLPVRHQVKGQLCFESSGKMTNFCKNEDCPSSNNLLEFERNKLAKTTTEKIRRHLAKCEFCAAEADFYSHFPIEDESHETAKAAGIPAPLFELAEALLKNRHRDSASLNSLLKRKMHKPTR